MCNVDLNTYIHAPIMKVIWKRLTHAIEDVLRILKHFFSTTFISMFLLCCGSTPLSGGYDNSKVAVCSGPTPTTSLYYCRDVCDHCLCREHGHENGNSSNNGETTQ